MKQVATLIVSYDTKTHTLSVNTNIDADNPSVPDQVVRAAHAWVDKMLEETTGTPPEYTEGEIGPDGEAKGLVQ